MDYYKLNQIVTPIATAISDIVSFLKQINILWHLVYSYQSGTFLYLYS
jgi:hypothetical protein